MTTLGLGAADFDAADFDALRAEVAAAPVTPQRVAEALRRRGHPVSADVVAAVHARVLRETVGLGPLQPLVDDPAVTDVLVNGPGVVRVDRGRGPEATDVVLDDEAQVRRLAQRLAALGGRRLDDAAWWCDVRLPDGTRCHAVLAPVARPGTAISLRVPRHRSFSIDDLSRTRMLSPVAARVVREVVAARLGFLVSGGTGTGKTTLLATMLSEVPDAERIVVVEDSSELRPDHPHVVGLEARGENVEGSGAVDLHTLVRQALRMRPDRLVLGEVRGVEVLDLLAAMNTGHEGGCGTLHANAATQVMARIEALAAPAGLGPQAVAAQTLAAVDVVLHVVRDGDGRRRLAQVAVLGRATGPDGHAVAVPALEFGADGGVVEGPGAQRLAALLAGRR
ncbi:TadA family conjugal transfer-associated ATPase [Nocardioides yefusunii]|uniref:TadA family conjugal transfer-associated ATPase n=1 Tax=Nocardioides yefusunii TaxID=2500546 RepID=A0ABW1QWS8_9ACTN|nr:TadA family conjugal transfer-associated ATPase [Nocardioides yefusunii]